MTNKQRSQYMGLSVVEGFVFEARNLKLEQKTKQSLKRAMNHIVKMKEALGAVLPKDGKHILEKHDRVKRVLAKQPKELFVIDYLNAVQMMVNIMQDNIPSREVQREWGKLEGMLFTVHCHLDESQEIDCVYRANKFCKELTLEVMS